MMLNTQIQNNKKQGVTLVEVLIVLAIAAVVIAGALVLYGNLQRNSAVNEETTNLSAMFQNIDNFFRRGTTGGLDNAQSLTAGFIPAGMLIDDTNGVIENTFGGYVDIVGSDVTGGNARGFAVTYTGVPVGACVNFVQGQSRVGWDAVEVLGVNAITDDATVALVTGGQSAYFRSTDGTGGARGSQQLTEISLISLCDTDQNYIDVSFIKDSEY